MEERGARIRIAALGQSLGRSLDSRLDGFRPCSSLPPPFPCGTLGLTFFLPLALSLSSCCFVLPNTLRALDTLRVCTADRLSHMSLASCSTNAGKRPLSSCFLMRAATMLDESSVKSALVLGFAVRADFSASPGVSERAQRGREEVASRRRCA